ncbi:MAG: ATP-binding protein, partial [Nitrospiraceae bacterium]
YVEERQEDLFMTVVGGMVLCALLVGIVVIGSNRTVTRPLGRLASKMRMFSESGRGTSLESLPPDRGDEVAQLDQAFHRMVEVIVGDEKELRDLNASLEQRVLERTEALRSMEEQFRQAQKIEAIGRLAGGVAHDFNNLMTVVTGYSELILTRLGPDDPLRKEIEEIKKAGDRAATLTGQLLAFSRKQVLAPKVLDLNSVVANINGMLRRLLAEDIELHTVVAPVLGRVKADPGQLEQVIMNLVVNARDAMPGGGRLTIETKNVELDKVYARSHVSVKPGAYVMLAITDGGSGMDATTQARIFEPFFTTKEPGKGTGLGLSTVYGVVKQSGGYIWVYSELGRGTTFKIYLPRVEDDLEARDAGPAPAETLQGSETILLAEDEDMVRTLARRILTSHGYTVLEARDGTECLRICEAHKGTIHLLMTDVVMPGLSGREVAKRVAPLRPDMKVLYLSGYADSAVVHHGLLDAGSAFLQKPFSSGTLAHKVREVLDASLKT